MTTFIMVSLASTRRGTTPDSLMRFPNIIMAISGDAAGTSTLTATMVTMGKMILVRRDTGLDA